MVPSGTATKKIPSDTTGIDPGTVQLVAQCLNHEIQLYIFFNLGARRGWTLNATSRATYPRKRDLTPTVHEAGWIPGAFWTGTENLVPTGIRSRHPSALGEWLYRLLCPGPLMAMYLGKTRNIFQCVIFIYNVKDWRAGCAKMLFVFSMIAVTSET